MQINGCCQLEKVIVVLEQLCDAATETSDTREDAAVIVSGTEKSEFVALLFFWSEVLSSTDRIQKCLQAKETTFFALHLLENLIDLIDKLKNELCARAVCNEQGARVSRRIKKISSTPDQNASDAGLSAQVEMHRSQREVLDKIVVEISDRLLQLRESESHFGFLGNS
jgi:hypothetical protein